MPVSKPFAAIAFAACALAAYRLRTTPLWPTATAVAAANAVTWSVAAFAQHAGRRGPRLLTALHHVTAALGGFFLFVSFALP